ncbi:MAG TPA: ATP-binding cassette domain-containing protein [Usitatibacter sp.]|nr:ATP-binding cassette domain-containing protein [Usitatibacter sp.]
MAEAMLPLEARGLGIRFGDVQALRDVDLAIEARRRIVVLGANGAGKSVLLRTLHGLLRPTTGTITWAGRAARPRSQAMVFQRPVLLRRTALANIEYALAIQGTPAAERERLAQRAIARVGLGHIARRQARALSGGEQQRIALARAWALEPALLFLDEPTSSLDPAAAGEVERIVQEIHAAGTTVVMTTHNLGLARRVADQIVFLDAGRLTEVTPAGRFFSAPASREAALFLAGELP